MLHILTAAIFGVWAWSFSTQASAAEAWRDAVRAEPFVCRADFTLSSYDTLFDELRRLQLELVRMLHVPAAAKQVELFLFRDQARYRRYLERYHPGVPHRRALFIKSAGRRQVYAYLSREFDVDIRHEATHALLHAALPTVPLWLDEGLAEYFEVPTSDRVAGNPHLPAVQQMLSASTFASLESLESIDHLADMKAGQYRQAWAWVHFMLHGPAEAQDELMRYLSDLENGHQYAGRLSHRLKRRIPEIELRFAEHFGNWR